MIPTQATRLEEYYHQIGDHEKLALQKASNEHSCLLFRRIACFHNATDFGFQRLHFFSNEEHTLMARGWDNNGTLTKWKEKNIYHAGYIWDLSVPKMNAKQKKNFVKNIQNMKIRSISENCLAVW